MPPAETSVFQPVPRTSAQNCHGMLGSHMKLKRTPAPFGVIGRRRQEKPSAITPSTAPANAAPEVSASILVTICSREWRSLLSPGTLTVTEALAVLPVPPLVDVTGPVVLVSRPVVVAVTLTENVQLVLGARVAPERLTLPLPAVAVMVPPPHDPDSPLGVATTSPAGNGSLNATPVSAKPLGLVMVKDSEVVPPA